MFCVFNARYFAPLPAAVGVTNYTAVDVSNLSCTFNREGVCNYNRVKIVSTSKHLTWNLVLKQFLERLDTEQNDDHHGDVLSYALLIDQSKHKIKHISDDVQYCFKHHTYSGL